MWKGKPVTLEFFINEARKTLRAPREGAISVMEWGIPATAVWPFFALSVVVSTLAAELNSALNPPSPGQASVYIPPLAMALMVFVGNVVMARSVSGIGKGFGGNGTFLSAVLLLAWQQLIWTGLLVPITLIGIVSSGISGLLFMFAAVWMMWILLNFVRVLHEFDSWGSSLVVFILSLIASGMVMLILATFFSIPLLPDAG